MAQAQAATTAVSLPVGSEPSEGWRRGKSRDVSRETLAEVGRHEAVAVMAQKEGGKKPTNHMLHKRLYKFAFGDGPPKLPVQQSKHFFSSESTLKKFAKGERCMRPKPLSVLREWSTAVCTGALVYSKGNDTAKAP